MQGLDLPKRVFPCAAPAEVRATLPEGRDVLAFQCRNPIHKAHYELFIRALDAPNVGEGAVCLVHPTCGPTQVRHLGDPEPPCTPMLQWARAVAVTYAVCGEQRRETCVSPVQHAFECWIRCAGLPSYTHAQVLPGLQTGICGDGDLYHWFMCKDQVFLQHRESSRCGYAAG